MLEHLINDESDKAKELFHQLVVEKSREIYEEILAEDFEELDEKKDEDEDDKQDESMEDDEEKVDEAKDDDEDMEESFGFAEGGDEPGDDVGGDAGDDMIDDLEADDDEGDDMGDEGDLEDRVMDLEDALDELKSEFEALMADEGGMDDMGGDDMGMDDMGGDDMDDKMELEQSFIREYTEKVSPAKMGDNGANSKSVVAGKNNMGGTTANIAKGGEEPTSASTKGGLLNPSTKEENFGNVNVPGGKAGVKHLKKDGHGHGAEKKGAAEQADKGAGSPLNGAPGRAK